MSIHSEEYGDYEVDCEINKKTSSYCYFTGEEIPDNEPHLLIYKMSIRLDSVSEMSKVYSITCEQEEHVVTNSSESYDYKFYIGKPMDLVCKHCGESLRGQEVFCVEEINNMMNWIEDYHDFHIDCFKEVIEEVSEEIKPDVMEDFKGEIVSSRL